MAATPAISPANLRTAARFNFGYEGNFGSWEDTIPASVRVRDDPVACVDGEASSGSDGGDHDPERIVRMADRGLGSDRFALESHRSGDDRNAASRMPRMLACVVFLVTAQPFVTPSSTSTPSRPFPPLSSSPLSSSPSSLF